MKEEGVLVTKMTAYKRCRFILLVLAMTAWATTLSAQTGQGKHVVSGFLGPQMFDRSNQFNDFGGDFGVDANLGGRYLYRLTDRWAIEGSLLFSPGNHKLQRAALPDGTFGTPIDEPDPLGNIGDEDDVFDEGTLDLRSVNARVNSWYYHANAVYTFSPLRNITPFATAGIGGVALDVKRGNTEQSLGFNFGGGATIPIKERLSTRIDVRDYVYHVNDLGAQTRQVLGVPQNFSSTIHDLSINFGMTWTF